MHIEKPKTFKVYKRNAIILLYSINYKDCTVIFITGKN